MPRLIIDGGPGVTFGVDYREQGAPPWVVRSIYCDNQSGRRVRAKIWTDGGAFADRIFETGDTVIDLPANHGVTVRDYVDPDDGLTKRGIFGVTRTEFQWL